MDNRAIGFFDSGVGGLTCIPAFLEKFPREKIIYYGDTARTPYGSKSADTIRKFAFQISDYLVSRDVKMLVVACNTISATCIGDLRNRYSDIPVVSIIEPTAEKIAAEEPDGTRIGIIGTRVTIASRVYEERIVAGNDRLNLYSIACPALVPLIEEGLAGTRIMELAVRHYLDSFVADNQIEKLVLGCTHYPLIASGIAAAYPRVSLISPSLEVAGRVGEILEERDMFSVGSDIESICYASDLSENFHTMVSGVFGENVPVRTEFLDIPGL